MQMLERSVADLLREVPRRARVFERYAIDYGCGSTRSLAEVCRQQQIDPDTILKSLAAEQPAGPDPFVRIRLDALADEIVTRHHDYAREQGQRIQSLLDKVNRVHVAKEPRLLALWSLFQQIHADLLQHMLKEEAVLFPYCRQLELATASVTMHCGSVAMPIRVMESEHHKTSEQMRLVENLTDGYTPPDWACNSFRVLYDELQAYVQDLEEHMHLENDLLFPAALRREAELKVVEETD